MIVKNVFIREPSRDDSLFGCFQGLQSLQLGSSCARNTRASAGYGCFQSFSFQGCQNITFGDHVPHLDLKGGELSCSGTGELKSLLKCRVDGSRRCHGDVHVSDLGALGQNSGFFWCGSRDGDAGSCSHHCQCRNDADDDFGSCFHALRISSDGTLDVPGFQSGSIPLAIA